jgi:hypothetical protein
MEFKKTACSHFYVKFGSDDAKWVRVTKVEFKHLTRKNKIDLLSNHLDTLSNKKLKRVHKYVKRNDKKAIRFIKKLSCKFKLSRLIIIEYIGLTRGLNYICDGYNG